MTQKAIPRYLRVYSSIKNQIENGDYKVGDFLPPEPELQKLFNVSRTTVRKAVEMLAGESFVSIKQGKGTEILDYKATQKLQYVTSFSETLREKGLSVYSKDITVDLVPAPRTIADNLKIEPESALVRIHRLTFANDKPIALMTNYLLPELVPDIEKRFGGMKSLYAFLETEYNINIEAATDFISASAATVEEADRLQIAVDSPLLIVRRITYSGNRAIEVALLHIVAEKYEYCVHTKDRPPHSGMV